MSKSKTTVVKVWATLLLILMAAAYVAARQFEHQHEAWPWVRAFAEAGMIGALADWFAVVALFRHPMGIPIPHTAIVQKKKDRIGERLAHFVRSNFLSAEVLRSQVVKHKLVSKGLEWLVKPENSRKVSQFIGKQVIGVAQNSDSQSFCKDVSQSLCTKLSHTPVERGFGRWIGETMHGEEFRSVAAPLLGKLATRLEDQREWVESEVGESASPSRSKLITKLSKAATKAFSSHVVNQLSKQLRAASENPEDPLHEKLEQTLAELAMELQTEEENSEWASWRQSVLQSENTQSAVATLLSKAGEMAASEQGELTGQLEKGLSKMALRTLNTPSELSRWEVEAGKLATNIADQYGDAFERLIVDRVAEWDGKELSRNLENSVGADLQYIRINGSLIGGLIGVALYAIGLYVWGS